MKIIQVDNFDREVVADVLIASDVGEYIGKRIVDFLNEKIAGDHSSEFFRLVPDDYKLFEGVES